MNDMSKMISGTVLHFYETLIENIINLEIVVIKRDPNVSFNVPLNMVL